MWTCSPHMNARKIFRHIRHTRSVACRFFPDIKAICAAKSLSVDVLFVKADCDSNSTMSDAIIMKRKCVAFIIMHHLIMKKKEKSKTKKRRYWIKHLYQNKNQVDGIEPIIFG